MKVIPFPQKTKLEQLLVLSNKRAAALARAIADDEGTPARIAYNVPYSKLLEALLNAGLTVDCKDGVLVIRPRQRREP